MVKILVFRALTRKLKWIIWVFVEKKNKNTRETVLSGGPGLFRAWFKIRTFFSHIFLDYSFYYTCMKRTPFSRIKNVSKADLSQRFCRALVQLWTQIGFFHSPPNINVYVATGFLVDQTFLAVQLVHARL